MKGKISFKGVIVGAIFDVVATGLIGGIILFLFIRINHLGHLDAETIAHSPIFEVAAFAIGATVSILAGYISAWIARRHELLNGALSSFLCVLIGVFSLVHGNSQHSPATHLVDIITTPILGLIGGYIRMKLVQKK